MSAFSAIAALLVVGVLAVACTSQPMWAPQPAATPTQPTATSTAVDVPSTPTPISQASPVSASAPAPTPTPLSPISLSTREVTFCVQVPDTTPPDEQVYLLVMPFLDWSWTQHVPLTNEGNGVWSGTASVEEGALVRYVYDR